MRNSPKCSSLTTMKPTFRHGQFPPLKGELEEILSLGGGSIKNNPKHHP